MTTFKYQAISKNGSKVSGVIEGYDEFDAVDRIKESCDIVLNIAEVKEQTGLMAMEVGGNKLNKKAFTLMCSQFAIILRAGIPVGRAVKLIADKITDKTLKKVLKQVSEDVDAGRSLATSLGDRGKKLFPVTFVETIRAGEESGGLDKAFDTMYRHYDKQMKMAGKVRSALTYPIFVLAIAVVVVIVLMVKVVPTFTSIFDSYDAEIPAMTRALINISGFFQHYWMVLALIVVGLVVVYKVYGNTETGRLNLAKASLKIPVLGNIQILNAASQFANTMVTLVGAGLSMTRAISVTAKVLDNYYIGQEVGKLNGKLEEGRSLGDSLRAAECMPDILVDMVAVGEQTGEMEQTLDTVASYYDAELEQAIQAALAKLEPTLLIVMAVVAGFIVVSIYVAMFEMYGVM